MCESTTGTFHRNNDNELYPSYDHAVVVLVLKSKYVVHLDFIYYLFLLSLHGDLLSFIV